MLFGCFRGSGRSSQWRHVMGCSSVSTARQTPQWSNWYRMCFPGLQRKVTSHESDTPRKRTQHSNDTIYTRSDFFLGVAEIMCFYFHIHIETYFWFIYELIRYPNLMLEPDWCILDQKCSCFSIVKRSWTSINLFGNKINIETHNFRSIVMAVNPAMIQYQNFNTSAENIFEEYKLFI